MPWKPPKSPYNLIQEHLWDDPWKLFVACIFCNLTRRVDSEPYMWKFFKKYPTPQIASLACQKEIQKMISNGFKLEVEALISKDISYVTETYVPERLADKDWLD